VVEIAETVKIVEVKVMMEEKRRQRTYAGVDKAAKGFDHHRRMVATSFLQ
jgi:hypothetical protein